MKTIKCSTRVSVLILLAILFLFSTCKKDEQETKYRVIATKDYTNAIVDNTSQVFYQGEKISLISGYSEGYRGDSVKIEYNYPDNVSIMAIEYEKYQDVWSKVNKTEYKFQDEHVTQYILYEYEEGSAVPFLKITMQYDGSNLLEEYWYTYDSGTWTAVYKMTFSYDGDKVIQSLISTNWTGSWELFAKEEVTYSGDNIATVTELDYYENAYHNTYKYEFLNENDLVKKIDMYSFESNAWIIDESISYEYDANRNLVSETDNYSDDIYKREYTYEEGKGNLSQVYFFPGGIISSSLPIPTKSVPGHPGDLKEFLAKKIDSSRH